jgi:hypothetical protein
MVNDGSSWCVVRLGDDYNWWVHEASEGIHCDIEMNGVLDPKQVEHMVDLLLSLRQYGLKEEIVNEAFITYTIDKEMPKERLRIRETKDDIFGPREPVFCLPNVVADQEGPFVDFIDHITALRVKLLNSSLDFQQPINAEEIEDILHAERQERYISGIKTHAFDEITSILDYVPLGYTLDSDLEDVESQDEDLDLSEFDDEVDESIEIGDEKGW